MIFSRHCILIISGRSEWVAVLGYLGVLNDFDDLDNDSVGLMFEP